MMVSSDHQNERHSSSFGSKPGVHDDAIRHYAREIRAYCAAISQRQTSLLGTLIASTLGVIILSAASTISLVFIIPTLVSITFCFGMVFELRRLATQILYVKPMLKSLVQLNELSNQERHNSGLASSDLHITSDDVELAIRAHAALDPGSEGARSIFRLFTPI